MGSPKRTTISLRNHNVELPTMAQGTTGTPDRAANTVAPSWRGRSSLSRKPSVPSVAMASTPPASNTRCTARTDEPRFVLDGLNGIIPPKKPITRFRTPFEKSTSLGPNQVTRGRSGLMAMTSSGSQPEWWLVASWNGAGGHRSSPSARTRNRAWTTIQTRIRSNR